MRRRRLDEASSTASYCHGRKTARSTDPDDRGASGDQAPRARRLTEFRAFSALG